MLSHVPCALAVRGNDGTFVLEESGKLAESWLPGPSVPTAPILAKFLDLDEAIAKAIASGFKLAPVEGKSYLDAWLTGVTGVSDKMTGATWTLISVDMSGVFPNATDRMTIDAATDAQTTEEAKAGRTERSNWPTSCFAASTSPRANATGRSIGRRPTPWPRAGTRNFGQSRSRPTARSSTASSR